MLNGGPPRLCPPPVLLIASVRDAVQGHIDSNLGSMMAAIPKMPVTGSARGPVAQATTS